MKSDTEAMTEEEAVRVLRGLRKANQAALYAHVRTLLAHSLFENNPIVGFHGFALFEDFRVRHISAGATPNLQFMLAAFAGMEGMAISNFVGRQVGDKKLAQLGDQFSQETGKTHCVGCEDGDPTGSHAEKELQENGRALLGLLIDVAESFYGPHLSEKARALLAELRSERLPADAEVS